MSELRDLTAALRTFDRRLTSMEDCLAVILRNSEQEADWRHEQRGNAQAFELRYAEQEKAVQKVEALCSSLDKGLKGLLQVVEHLAQTRFEDVKELKARVNKLESDRPEPEEVTQA